MSSILLAILLLLSTSGLTIHKHYCESALVAVSLIPSIEDACDSDMPMDKDTCRDDHQEFSIESPIVLLSINFDMTPSFEWLSIVQIILNQDFTHLNQSTNFLADISPPPSEPDIYLRVQSFLL